VVARLLNQPPNSTDPMALCGSYSGDLLNSGSNPATGLLIDKLASPPPCGMHMPEIGSITSTQASCVQAWATAVTTGVITQ